MNNALTKIATAQAAAGGRYPRFGSDLLEVEVIRTKASRVTRPLPS